METKQKSMGAFCCHGNQTKRQITIIFCYFELAVPKQHFTKLEPYCFSGFGGVI